MENVKYVLYTIQGEPIPLNRPRFSGAHVYDSQKEAKLITGINLKNQHEGQPLFSGILHIDLEFYMTPPVKRYKQLLGTYHHYRPDIDNLIKFVLDCAKGILITDDCIIASINAFKRYDKSPRTLIVIKELCGQEQTTR